MVEVLGNPLVWLFGGLAVSWAFSAVSYYWYKAYRAQLDANLTQAMIQRGMTADDILKVLAAQSGPRSSLDGESEPEPDDGNDDAAK